MAEPLEPMTDEELRMLQIAPPDDVRQRYAFYEVRGGPSAEAWSVLGVCEEADETGYLEVRLLEIDQELIEDGWGKEGTPGWPVFDSFTASPGYLWCDPTQYEELIATLERWAEPHLDAGPLLHFVPVSQEELASYYVKPMWLQFHPDYYRYLPEPADGAPDGAIHLLKLPKWTPEWGMNQASTMKFSRFQPERLTDPEFDPHYTWGLGVMTFRRSMLGELLTLMRQHRFTLGQQDIESEA
jgi:hypothetical protein